MTSKYNIYSPNFLKKDNFFNPFYESHTEIRRVKATGKSSTKDLIEAVLRLKSDRPISRVGLQDNENKSNNNKKSKISDFLKGSVIIFDQKY